MGLNSKAVVYWLEPPAIGAHTALARNRDPCANPYLL